VEGGATRGPPALEAARAKRRIMTTQDTANRFKVSVSAEEAGYANDSEYDGYTFQRPSNSPGTPVGTGAE